MVNNKSGGFLMATEPQIYAIGSSPVLCLPSSAERSEVPARRETIFIQNKPNYKKAKMNVNKVLTKDYENE
jgi:hypothetical protein